MKNIISSHTTQSGTRAIVVSNGYTFNRDGEYQSNQSVVILLDASHNMIAVFPQYPGLSEKFSYNWNIAGTDTEKYLTGKIFYSFKVAQVEQNRSALFHYHNPISRILKENSDSEKVALKNKLIDLELTVKNLKEFGTDSKKEIEKIKAKREKQAKVLAKKTEKLFKLKIQDNEKRLSQKLKDGFNWIAVMRVYSNKGRTFHGESLEFRREKPTTKSLFEIGKLKSDRLQTAKYLAKNYPSF